MSRSDRISRVSSRLSRLLDAHDDNGGNTVAGHDHAVVLFVNAVDDLGEPVLDGRK